jgi:hypothetical protein
LRCTDDSQAEEPMTSFFLNQDRFDLSQSDDSPAPQSRKGKRKMDQQEASVSQRQAERTSCFQF